MGRDEIPSTEQGLILYINHCESEIKRCDSLKIKMKNRMKWCQERLEAIREEKQKNGST